MGEWLPGTANLRHRSIYDGLQPLCLEGLAHSLKWDFRNPLIPRHFLTLCKNMGGVLPPRCSLPTVVLVTTVVSVVTETTGTTNFCQVIFGSAGPVRARACAACRRREAAV